MKTITLLIFFSFCFFDVVYSQSSVLQVGERRILEKSDSLFHVDKDQNILDKIVRDEIIFKFKKGIDLNTFKFSSIDIQDEDVEIESHILGYKILRAIDSEKSLAIAQAMHKSDLFESIDFNTYINYTSSDIGPNDPFYLTDQYYLYDQSFFPDATQNIQMEKAWNLTTGSKEVIVGVIDSGVNYDHLELKDSMWENIGWNFVSNNNDPHDNSVDGHGTAMAGIIGASTNNLVSGSPYGIAGIAGGWGGKQWGDMQSEGVRIMALKTSGSFDFQSTRTQINNAIEYAANNGAHIINFSLSTLNGPYNDTIDAINYAVDQKNVAFVASSGNTGGPGSPNKSVGFPANLMNTIAVGAAIYDDTRWEQQCSDPTSPLCNSGSSYGNELDLVAPGGHPYIIAPMNSPGNNSWTDASGTSASTAIVSGVAALMKSINYNLTPAQIKEGLQNSAYKVSEMGSSNTHIEYGYGRVDTYQAVVEALKYDPNNIVIEQNTTLNNQTFTGEYIYVLEDVTLTLSETTVLEKNLATGRPSRIYVLGTLKSEGSNSTLELYDESEIFVHPTGRDNFRGSRVIDGEGSCTMVFKGGEMILGDNIIYQNGGFMASNGGTFMIEDNLIIAGPGNNDGYAIDVSGNTDFLMGKNANITIQPGAKMRAEGTEENPIRFIRADPNEAWGTIYLNSSEENSIKWALFDGGSTNLTIASQNNKIENSTFRNATFRNIDSWHNNDGTGNSSATLSHVLIEDGATVGLVAQYIDLDISNTTIQNNTQAGMYITSASVYPFHHNEIINNGGSYRDGVEVMSSGTFYMHDDNLEGGYNVISDNADDQVSGSGDISVGFTYPASDGGYNSMKGDFSGSSYLVSNTSSTTVMAERVWWGQTYPQSSMFYGPVQYDMLFLYSDPTTGENPGSGGQTPAKALPSKEGEVLPLADVYDQLERDLEKAETEQQVRDGLHSLYQVSWLAKKEAPELSGRFRQLARQSAEGKTPLYESAAHNQTLQHTATLLYAKSFIRDGDYESADRWLRETDHLSLEGNDRRDRLHLEMDLHRYNGNVDAALETLQALYAYEESRGVDIESAKRSYQPIEEDMVRRMGGDGSIDPDRAKQAADLSSTEGLTLQNYPNPFNPTTQVRFTLPQQSEMSLVVYDMLGREVARLVDEVLQAGEQTVRFDASNLANGVYIYRLNANQQERVRMMTLIK